MTDYQNYNSPELERNARYAMRQEKSGTGKIIAAILVLAVIALGIWLFSGTSVQNAATPTGAESQSAPAVTNEEAQPANPAPQSQPAPTEQ